MAWNDSRKPLQSLETTNGVKVIVTEPFPPPSQTPEPSVSSFSLQSRVVVLPPGQPLHEREAFVRGLYEQHGDFILEALLKRGDISDASARDMRQRVILILCDQFQDEGELDNVRAYLVGVIRKEMANHRRASKARPRQGSDPDAEVSGDRSPEEAVGRAELLEKLERYLTELTTAEQEAIDAIDRCGMTYVAAGKALNLSPGTVCTRHTRARNKLVARAYESERATELGERRRPPR